MSDIDIPALKEILWQRMQADLRSLVPWFRDYDQLLCPTCCRPLGFDDFSVEHIIPKQALANDAAQVRAAVTTNDRSGITLLCRKPLVYKGKRVNGLGCNSWKGKYFDNFLKEILRADLQKDRVNTGHQVSLTVAGYLALFRQFGYQVVLIASGKLMREQFFHPFNFRGDIPLSCQMILGGAARQNYNEEERTYWSEPFKITVEDGTAVVALRNLVFRVPLSRDPSLPIARTLLYAPRKHILRPDLTSAFD